MELLEDFPKELDPLAILSQIYLEIVPGALSGAKHSAGFFFFQEFLQ